MNASETKLQPIIEGTKQYVVPLFQRTYSWDRTEWEVLWNDLVELCQVVNPRTHFLGSMVTMQTNSVPEGVTKYLLIDGQQRLTTIFILLALLRDQAKQSGQEELWREIEDTLLVNRYKKDDDYYKFQPTQTDRATFRQLIRGEELTAQNQITKACQFFKRKLQQSVFDGQALKKAISSNLSVVSIVLDPNDDPYLVFESLNAKGRPLTQSDLIRNYFFMKIHVSEQEDIYARYWGPMQEALGENLTEFIRHYLMKDGTLVKQREIYFYLKDLVNKGDALDCLKNLVRFAEYYQRFLVPEKEPDTKIRHALSRIQRIEVTTAYPFLLNCYDDYALQKISTEEFVAILQVIENFMVRRFVCNVAANSLNKTFPPLYAQIRSRTLGTLVEGVRQILQTKGYPKNTEFRQRLMDTKLYGAGDRTARTKLLLESIEAFYQHKERVNPDELSIEHVMPQTLTGAWESELGEDWETTHELMLHTLGNLTLTAYNAVLSNDSFASKKEHFAKSHLDMNKYFEDKIVWNREEIEKRSSFLADKALLIWPYFGDEKVETNEQKKVTGIAPKALCILDQPFEVHSWRDVLEQTMNTIADLEPEKFEKVVQLFPRFIGRNKAKFKDVRELKNGVFVEVNLSSQDIRRFCSHAIETIELTTEDWVVEIA